MSSEDKSQFAYLNPDENNLIPNKLELNNFRAGKAPADSNTKMVKILLFSQKYRFENDEIDSLPSICRVILMEDHKFIEYGTIWR